MCPCCSWLQEHPCLSLLSTHSSFFSPLKFFLTFLDRRQQPLLNTGSSTLHWGPCNGGVIAFKLFLLLSDHSHPTLPLDCEISTTQTVIYTSVFLTHHAEHPDRQRTGSPCNCLEGAWTGTTREHLDLSWPVSLYALYRNPTSCQGSCQHFSAFKD